MAVGPAGRFGIMSDWLVKKVIRIAMRAQVNAAGAPSGPGGRGLRPSSCSDLAERTLARIAPFA